MRLSLDTITIRNAGLKDKFRLTAEAGFEGIELWGYEIDDDPTAPREILSLVDEYELIIEGVCPQPDLCDWHYQWNSNLEAKFERRLSSYGKIGAGYLVLPVISEDGTLEQTSANLVRICEIAAKHNLAVGLEPIGHVKKLAHIAKAFEIVAKLNVDACLGVILDIFHFFRAGHKLVDLQGLDPEIITTVHIDDAMDVPLNELVGYRHRLYPGEGIFDGVGFCAAIHATGYKGPYVVELLNESYWQADPTLVSRRAYQTSRQLLDDAFSRSS